LGKFAFARCLAQLLLCHSSHETPCGVCRGCILFAAGTHPDYLETRAEEGSEQIRIDQIRGVNYFTSLSSQYDHHRVALIADAAAMNRNAANGLLKTLEEPPPFSAVVLVTAQPAMLPATVVSRCQQLVFSVPPHHIAATWLGQRTRGEDVDVLLALAQGEPLTALALSSADVLDSRRKLFGDLTRVVGDLESPVTVAYRWQQYPLEVLLKWLLSALTDIAKLHWNSPFNRLNNPDIDQHLRALAKRIDLNSLFALYDSMLLHRRLQQEALNQALRLEEILLTWKRAFAPTG
jgi:DNA polymerase-3 subunit delta'